MTLPQIIAAWIAFSILSAIPVMLFFKACKLRREGEGGDAPSDRAHGGRVGSNNLIHGVSE